MPTPASKREKKIIPLCSNNGFCTEDCPDRVTCTKPRIPLLIPALVIHYRRGEIYGDEYINELAQVKQERVDLVSHQGGNDFRNNFRTKIRLAAV